MQIELVRQSIVVVAAATWPKCDYEAGAGAQGGAGGGGLSVSWNLLQRFSAIAVYDFLELHYY